MLSIEFNHLKLYEKKLLFYRLKTEKGPALRMYLGQIISKRGIRSSLVSRLIPMIDCIFEAKFFPRDADATTCINGWFSEKLQVEKSIIVSFIYCFMIINY